MVSGNSCKVNQQVKRFKENFVLANNNFQTEVDYNNFFNKGRSCCKGSGCGSKGLNKASDYVAATFDCLSMVLEMPYIENTNTSNRTSNSSVESSINLGHSILEPILATF